MVEDDAGPDRDPTSPDEATGHDETAGHDEAAGSGSSAVDSLADALRTLDPAYFGLAMSTGIVSIAFRGLGVEAVALPLSVFNVGCYALLVALFGAKTARFPGTVLADLRNSKRHWGTLTFVVATNTVGTQLVLFFDEVTAAAILWSTTVVATPVLLYYLFAVEIVGPRESAARERVDGAFLLAIVCMQSLAVLGALLADSLSTYVDEVVLLSMGYWGSGFVLYFVVVTVVTYRLLDGAVRPSDWTGPYWITMGAAAITTLAGATLGPRLSAFPAWEPYVEITLGITFLAWAIASWWIPLLLAIDVWSFLTADDGRPPAWVIAVPWARLAFGRRRNAYSPGAWGRVFPMGMYTACTVNLAGVHTFSPLGIVPAYWGWFALFVWGLTFVGMVRAAGRAIAGAAPAATGGPGSRSP
ncbi:tellurite resistance/C4-dicarboxylate transporter family protein [Halomicrobium urmianum]|uniref:tellurite resistance/C4-dicarboxylate transporter family protein n=1 Tax=Halomicrobium urmianum TaxID=1586233 RepID=UPI001CD9C0AA|nr:tellurite resistance/C4-dicarboxylate transporter family protein [Halomicrobium urmianum]